MKHVFYRVWGSEETVNDYKVTIRIFSVRHQDNPGLQERFDGNPLTDKVKAIKLLREGWETT